jgi:hypothetical protein
MTSKISEPLVTGPRSKHAGKRFRLGKAPQRQMARHNEVSWRIIVAIMEAYGSADYWDLACACRGHLHENNPDDRRGPQHWVDYCIKREWLVEVS